MAGIFDFLKTVYGMLGFTYTLKLSTRPDNYIGELAVWNEAEKVCDIVLPNKIPCEADVSFQRLASALDKFVGVGEWDVDPGDGAFYGPKVCSACGTSIFFHIMYSLQFFTYIFRLILPYPTP